MLTTPSLRAGEYYFQDESADYYALFSSGAVKLYHPDSAGGISDQKFETTGGGISILVLSQQPLSLDLEQTSQVFLQDIVILMRTLV